ncbi:MAG TPA: hemolysin family protein [Planctomycetota bacterium]|nr:hemolysin family protein [Planctomycetota bacterium]
MSGAALWTTGLVLLSVTFFLSLLYSSFNLCSRSRLRSLAGERRRLKTFRTLLPRLTDTTPRLLVLKFLTELALVAVILLGPLLGVKDPAASSTLKVVLEVVVAVVAVLVICELIPRGIAQRRGEEIVLTLGHPAYLVSMLGLPLVRLKHLIDEIIARLLPSPLDASPGEELADEVLDAVTESEAEGTIKPDEREMIRSVISFREVDVAEIMTPRTEMIGVEASATSQQAIELMLQHGFSRVPVYEHSRDNIVAVVHIKDLIREVRRDPNKPLTEVASPPYFVPETKPIAELLREFQAKKLQFAIVVDEYGGTAGIVTVEDIVEEIVGEIDDEYDSRTQILLRRLDEHTVEADGRCRIDDLNDILHVQIPEDAEYDTIGGFAVSALGHIPQKGETFRYRDVSFEILDVDERRVKKVRVQVPPEPPADEP